MEADDQQLELLGALEALGGSAGNSRLRDLLGWDEDTYEAVKGALVSTGQLQPGRGRGGSVSLAGASAAEAVEATDQAKTQAPEAPSAASKRTTLPAPPPGPQPSGKQNLSAFIWSVADLLRGDYKQSDYGKVILPFTVLRPGSIACWSPRKRRC